MFRAGISIPPDFILHGFPVHRYGGSQSGLVGKEKYPRERGWNAQTIYESEMALFNECMQSCAHIVLGTSDIVIALGKVWKRRNRR